MLYQVGDYVLIRSDLIGNKDYNGLCFAQEMERFRGQIIKIESINNYANEYYSNTWYWNDAMIERKVDDPNAPVSEFPTFRVRCIDNSGYGFEVNEIYTVTNGILKTKEGSMRCDAYGNTLPFINIDDINNHYTSKFILVENDETQEKEEYKMPVYFKVISTITPSHFEPNAIYVYNGKEGIKVNNEYILYGSLDYIKSIFDSHCKYEIISEEEYKKYIDPKNFEYAAERLSYSLEHAFKELIEKEQAELRRIQMNYRNIKSNLNQTYEELRIQEKLIKSLSGNKSFKENILKELTKINASKFCKSIKIENNNLSIYTNHLYITEPNTGKRYDLGEMKFSIPINKEQPIVIENLTRRVYGYSDDMHHPHIFSDGDACWGDADCQVATYRAENEYYALFTTIINFCQTCDIDDCAGWYVSCWDEVDDNNQVITKGHKPHYDEYDGYGCHETNDDDWHECEICDNGGTEDDMYYCEDCDNWFCEDHAQYYDELDKTLCDNCIEENYFTCNHCNELRPNYNYNAIDTEDGQVCKRCAENHYIKCEKCGSYIYEENIFEHEDHQYCESCHDEILEDLEEIEEESEEEGSIA